MYQIIVLVFKNGMKTDEVNVKNVKAQSRAVLSLPNSFQYQDTSHPFHHAQTMATQRLFLTC